MIRLTVGIALLVSVGLGTDRDAGQSASTILSGEALRAAGITRLSDILWLSPDAPTEALISTLGWSAGWPSGSAVNLRLAGRIGISRFEFEGSEGYEQHESELVVALAGSLNLELSERLTLSAGLRRMKVFTAEPFGMIHYHAGLIYHMPAPLWLRRFLQ